MVTTNPTLQTEPVAPKAPSTEYTWEKIIHSHIWLIYCISFPYSYVGSKEYLKQLSTESVREILAHPRIKKLIGKWELVWGMSIFQVPGSGVNDNTLYIAKHNDNNPEKDTYLLCVAGTNMKSIYNIIFEDCDVFSTKEWNNGKPWESPPNFEATTEPSLSSGITRGVNALFNKTKDSDGTLLIDALQKITSSSSKPIDLIVIGHSLGGALAPVTALSLFERQSEWDSKGIATIKEVWSLAGITPGNQAFQDYYQSKLGDKTQRLWCSLDIVPHCFHKDGLANAAGLYHPVVPSTPLIETILWAYNKSIEHFNYQSLTPQEYYVVGQANSNLCLANINEYPYLKEFLAEQCAGMLLYAFLSTLENLSNVLEDIPFVGQAFEPLKGQMLKTIKSSCFIVSNFLAEIINARVTVDQIDDKIEEVFDEVLDYIGIPVDISLVMGVLPDGLISAESIFNLMDWVMQLYFHHTDQYVAYYGIQEFYDIRGEITAQLEATLGKEENKKQPANTVLVDYGKAKNDDIKDLYRGKGKLLENISDVVAELKQSGEVEKNAQPLVLIVEKK